MNGPRISDYDKPHRNKAEPGNKAYQMPFLSPANEIYKFMSPARFLILAA